MAHKIPNRTHQHAKHGHHPKRQTLWNWKTGNSPVPEHVEVILEGERKARLMAK